MFSRKNTLVALTIVGTLMGIGGQVFAGEDPILVDLALTPDSTTIAVGDTVQLDVFATPQLGLSTTTSGLDIIMNWENSFLSLTEAIPNPLVDWVATGFPNDAALDGLNNDQTDGEVVYQLLAPFVTGASIPSEGLLVASFVFEAIQATPAGDATDVSMPLAAGQFTMTTVTDGTIPGLNILGDTFGSSITIVPEPGTVALMMVGAFGFVRRRVQNRR